MKSNLVQESFNLLPEHFCYDLTIKNFFIPLSTTLSMFEEQSSIVKTVAIENFLSLLASFTTYLLIYD